MKNILIKCKFIEKDLIIDFINFYLYDIINTNKE